MIDHLVGDLEVLRKADVLIGKIMAQRSDTSAGLICARGLDRCIRARDGESCGLHRLATMDRSNLVSLRHGNGGFRDRGDRVGGGRQI